MLVFKNSLIFKNFVLTHLFNFKSIIANDGVWFRVNQVHTGSVIVNLAIIKK